MSAIQVLLSTELNGKGVSECPLYSSCLLLRAHVSSQHSTVLYDDEQVQKTCHKIGDDKP